VITTASILLLAAGGIGYTAYASSDKETTTEVDNTRYQQESETQEQVNELNNDFQEFDVLDELVDTDDFHAEIVKDNDHKRIILLEDDHHQPQYKSIYVKDKNRLKVIDFSDGVIFHDKIENKGQGVKSKESEDQITESAKEVTKESKETKEDTKLTKLDEYSTIQNHADVKDYDANIVEDNKNKRVIVFKDDHNKPQYKSIYVKHKGFVKVIDLHGGLVYKGSIQ